jgi:hypothetical protein
VEELEVVARDFREVEPFLVAELQVHGGIYGVGSKMGFFEVGNRNIIIKGEPGCERPGS